MTNFKYTLERYQGSKTKHICPQCNKKTLTRYIDAETSEYLNHHVGRCDREDNCSYHYKPADYFKDSGEGTKKVVFRASFPTHPTQKVYIPLEILKKSRLGYVKNCFVRHLSSLFDQATVNNIIATYHLGTSDSRWPGACVFWFIGHNGLIHAGQVKLFKDGHTASYEAEGELKKCTTWIHSILKAKLQPTPSWLTSYCDQEKKVGCMFGEHLIKTTAKPFAIVEAPATAIVASVYLPQYTWLAVGSLSYLNAERCKVLKGNRVVLYPDLGAFDKWKKVANDLGFDCSNLLEENASDEDKAKGLDLRDYLERFSVSEFIKPTVPASSTSSTLPEFDLSGNLIDLELGYPVTWKSKAKTATEELIARFDLVEHDEQLTTVPWDFDTKPTCMPMWTIEQYRQNGWRYHLNTKT